MKKLRLAFVRTAFLSFVCTLLFSCSEDIPAVESNESDQEIPVPKVIEVLTLEPEVDRLVLFKGEIKSLSGVEDVEYGFMWYVPDVEEIDVQEIKIGRTDQVMSFEHEITNLPKEPKLIVCSFARVANTGETIIGEEVPFSNDL